MEISQLSCSYTGSVVNPEAIHNPCFSKTVDKFDLYVGILCRGSSLISVGFDAFHP